MEEEGAVESPSTQRYVRVKGAEFGHQQRRQPRGWALRDAADVLMSTAD